MPPGAHRRVLSVALCAVAVAIVFWSWPGSATEPLPAPPEAPSPSAAGTHAASAPAAGTTERRELAATMPAPTTMGVTVRGRCIAAEDGAPLAATLRMHRDDGTPDGEPGALPAQVLAFVSTQADGRFLCTVPLTAAADLRLHLEAPERASVGARRVEVAPGSTWDTGDVRLVRTARVRGKVVDTAGAAVAAAQVQLVMIGQERPAPTFRDVHSSVTDARGAFTFAVPIAAGEWYLRVERTGALRAPRKTQVPAGGEHVVSIEVERPDPALAIRGTVVDRHGAPLPGVELTAHGEGARGSAVSGADGAFVLPKGPPHFDRGQPGVDLEARSPGLEQDAPAKGQVAKWGQHDVVVVMRPLAEVVVRAHDARGGVVWPFTVALGRVSQSGEGWLASPASRQRAEVDHVVLTQVFGGAHTLLLLPQDPALALAGPTVLTVDETSPRELEVLVPDRALVQVDVVDGSGAPVPLCRLELIASFTSKPPDPGAPAPDLATARASTGPPPRQFALARATTDQRGRAVLAAPPGTWLLRARCGTHLPVAQSVAIATGVVRHRLELVAAAVVRGTLVPAGVLPSLGLHEQRPERRLSVVARAGKAEIARAEVAADGTFMLGPLPPGVATLRLATWLGANDVQAGVVQHQLGDVDGTGAGQLERTYDVRAFAPATAVGVVAFDGAPLRNGQFFLMRLQPEPAQTVRVPTDGEGRFRTLVPPGELGLRLAIPSDPGPGHVILPTDQRWSVEAGTTIELRLEARTRRLRLRMLQPDGAPLALARVQLGGDGYDRPGALHTDAQGRVDVALAPYGTFRVQARDAAGGELVSEPCRVEPAVEAGVVDVTLAPRSR